MSDKFVWKKSDGSWTKPHDLATAMGAAAKQMLHLGPFQCSVDGEPVGREGSRVVVLRRLRNLLANGDVGPTYRIRNDAGVLFTVRAVKDAIDVVNTNGNAKADQFWSEVVVLFKDYHPRFAGAYVCKPSSQHRFGNAVDIFFDTLADQDKVAAWAYHNADRLNIMHIISRNRIWTRGVGWHAYTGDYHNHIHVDFVPNFDTGLGCGVRG